MRYHQENILFCGVGKKREKKKIKSLIFLQKKDKNENEDDLLCLEIVVLKIFLNNKEDDC